MSYSIGIQLDWVYKNCHNGAKALYLREIYINLTFRVNILHMGGRFDLIQLNSGEVCIELK